MTDQTTTTARADDDLCPQCSHSVGAWHSTNGCGYPTSIGGVCGCKAGKPAPTSERQVTPDSQEGQQ